MLDFFNLGEVRLLHIVFAIAILVCGYWIAKLTSVRVGIVIEKMLSKHQAMLVRRLMFYGAMLLFLVAALQQLGFKLGVLLGAAGVFTVGIGFAAQTSLANLISGLFLLIERPFKIGDTIIAKGFTGVVESIDLLSTRLCTSENTLVRIPNENVMQAEIVNLSYFPNRSVTLSIGLEYGTNFGKVRTVLLEVAKENSLALSEPKPTVTVADFGASAINIQFSVWGLTSNYSNLKSSLQEAIQTTFEKESISMAFPQMVVRSAPDEKLDTSLKSE
jgi:small-conductance mechanosensitive channel